LGLAKRWESKEGPAGAEWIKDALLQLEEDPEFIGVAWVSNNREVLSSAPSGAQVPVEFASDGPAARAFAQAGAGKSAAVFLQIDLDGGRPGVMIAAPLWRDGEFRGVIAGFFDSRVCVRKAMSDSRPEWEGYSFSVTSGASELYRIGEEPLNAWAQQLPVSSSMVDWKVSAWPGEDVVHDYISALPHAIFALGLVSSFFVSALFSLVQTNRLRRKELENANRLLGAEAVQRGRTEAELRRSEEKFRAIVETMSDWIWEMDESARYT
jgi:PAS domain-containing protein